MAVNVVVKSVFDDKGVRDAQQTLGNLGKGIGVGFAAVSAAVIGATAVIADFASKAVSAAEDVRQADNRLGQVAESMGLFGAQTKAVTDRLIGLAEANEINLATDAETIKLAQAKLLTFKELAGSADEAGGAFDRATMAALDLAAAGFGSAETNATQLGKALQDPIKGLTALTRSGVTFTAEEKKKIKTLVESGKTLQAQDMILKAIETQVGGTAAATAKSSDKMKLAFENVYETVGEALLPVFDELTVAITDLTPEISKALTPVFAELGKVFRDEIVPLIKEFTGWLASPKGTQAVRDLAKAVVDTAKGFFDMTKYVFENYDQIKQLAVGVGIATIAIKTFTTALELAKTAQLLFNIAVSANPYIIAASAIIGLTAAMVGLMVTADKAAGVYDVTTKNVGELQEELTKLKFAYEDGLIPTNKFIQKQYQLESQLRVLAGQSKDAAGEANRFANALRESRKAADSMNKASLANYRSQLGDTRVDAEKLVNAQRELAYYMNGGKPGTYKPLTSEETGGGGGGGDTTDTVAETRKKVQKIIQDTQKRIANAQATYRKAVADADKAFVANEIKIRQDYGVKLAGVIEQSKNRIRDAFRSVAEYNVATFLQSFREVEDARLKSFEDAKKAAEEVGTAFTQVFIKGDPVKAYLDNLRAKIAANKKILDTSAKLLEAGFSQTFIEQIIATGNEGGLALAEGLLASSPETISEVKALFKEIESISTTGANALADKLYKEQGLATQELVKLFEDTNQELNDALAANYADYTSALEDAGLALKDSIKDITDDFNAAIEEMDGKVGGLTATIKAFKAELTGVAEDTMNATNPIAGVGGGKTQGETGFVFDVLEALGQDGISNYAGEIFPIIPKPAQITNTTKPTTVINVNVATDQTQSTAQVGQVIANAINKYTGVGGKINLL